MITFNKNDYQTPKFEVPGDREDKIMIRSAELRAATKTKALWVAGFMPESDAGQNYNCSTKKFYWLLCDKKGNVKEKYVGFYCDDKFPFRKLLK